MVSLLTLCALGLISARLGGAPLARGTLRLLTWGVVAMTGTGLVGALFFAIAFKRWPSCEVKRLAEAPGNVRFSLLASGAGEQH